MAETSKRSDLIRQQIEVLLKNPPPPITEAERQTIMRGRKKQADIDAGREAIRVRTEEVNGFNRQLKELNDQLGATETQEGTAAETAKRAEGSDPVMNIGVPAAAGAGTGGVLSYGINHIVGSGDRARTNAIVEIGDEIGPTKDLTNSQMNRSRAVGAAKAAEKYVAVTSGQRAVALAKRSLSYGIPAAAIGFEYNRYNKIAEDEGRPWEERQGAARIANGFLGAGTGVGIEGSARALNAKIGEGEGRAMMRIEAARDFANRMDGKDIGNMSGNALVTGPDTVSGPRNSLNRGAILEAGPTQGNALRGVQPAAPEPRRITTQATPSNDRSSTLRADNLSTSGDTGDMGAKPSAPPTKIDTQKAPSIPRGKQMQIDNFSASGEHDLGKDPGKAPTKIEPQKTPTVDEALPYRQRLAMGAEAAGGKGARTKAATYEALKRGVTADNLPAVAKALNLPETASKSVVLQRAREMMRTTGKSAFFLPAVAGGLAYEMASGGPVEAADGSAPASGGIGNKATAGATAAGTAYGVNRIVNAIPPAARTAVGMAGEAMGPATIDAMTDPTQGEVNAGRNWLARNTPEAMQFGGVSQAREMAQVPQASPMRANALAGNPEFDRAYQDFLAAFHD